MSQTLIGLCRIEDHEPAEAGAAAFNDEVLLCADEELLVLADYHDGRHSWVVVYDRTQVWAPSGAPNYLAVHIVRDEARRTFEYVSQRLPLLPFAQQWIIARGCPAEPLRLRPDLGGASPADVETTALEARLAVTPAQQYEILDHHSSDDPVTDQEVWVLLRDRSGPRPYRVVLQHHSLATGQYRLTEGAFADEHLARRWLRKRSGLLPSPAPEPVSRPPGGPGRGPRR